MRYWVMKSEPKSYSIDDFEEEKITPWEGVRNYQARNFMMWEMSVGDLLIFYHSNTPPLGAAGVGKVVSAPSPDPTALDPASRYFDPRASLKRPIWYLIEIAFVYRFAHFVPLCEMRSEPLLEGNMLVRKASRLSVQPLTEEGFHAICAMGQDRKTDPCPIG